MLRFANRENLILTLLCLSIGIYCFIFGYAGKTQLKSDMLAYWTIALEFPDVWHYKPNGYSLIIMPIARLFEDPMAVIGFNFFLHFVTLMLYSFAVKRLLGFWTALVFSLIYGLSNEVVGLNNLVLTEVGQNFVQALLIYFAVCLRNPTITVSLFGFILGFSGLVKPTIMVVLFPLSFLVVLKFSGFHFQKFVRYLVLLLVCFSISPTLNGFRNLSYNNEFVPYSSNGPVNLFIGHNKKSDGLHSSSIRSSGIEDHQTPKGRKKLTDMAWEYRRTHKKQIRSLTIKRFQYWWGSEARGAIVKQYGFTEGRGRSAYFLNQRHLIQIFLLFFPLFCLITILKLEPSNRHRKVAIVALSAFLLMTWVNFFRMGDKFYYFYSWLMLPFALYVSLFSVFKLLRNRDVALIGPTFIASIPMSIWVVSALYCHLFFIKVRFGAQVAPFYAIAICAIFSYILQYKISKSHQNS